MLCYQVFSPFLMLMVWAVILAVTLYPLHQYLAARWEAKQGLAATILVLLGIVLIVVPTAVLMNSLGDSVHQLITTCRRTRSRFRPRARCRGWPLVGEKLHAIWSEAYADLPALIESLQPKIGDLAKRALGFVAGIGGGLLQFLAAFIIAGIIMAFGERAAAEAGRSSSASSAPRGRRIREIATATIRAVAQGVIGVAFIQAIVVGLCLLVAGVPWAGVLAVIVLVLGIAQVPALLVTLPAIVYIWSRGDYGSVVAIVYRVLLFVCGHGRQRAEAADARPRRRRADAGHPARRARGHGDPGHSRHVRRCHAAGAGLPDIHGMGGGPR